MATKKKTKKAPAKLYVDPESDFAKSAAAPTPPPEKDPLQTAFEEAVSAPDTTRPPMGFIYSTPDTRLSQGVQAMLHAFVNPKKKLRKVITLAVYDDNTTDTVFEVRGERWLKVNASVDFLGIDLDMLKKLSLSPSSLPESVKFEEVLTMRVSRTIHTHATDGLIRRLEEAKKRYNGLGPVVEGPPKVLKNR
jgi:hypothetical protein